MPNAQIRLLIRLFSLLLLTCSQPNSSTQTSFVSVRDGLEAQSRMIDSGVSCIYDHNPSSLIISPIAVNRCYQTVVSEVYTRLILCPLSDIKIAGNAWPSTWTEWTANPPVRAIPKSSLLHMALHVFAEFFTQAVLQRCEVLDASRLAESSCCAVSSTGEALEQQALSSGH